MQLKTIMDIASQWFQENTKNKLYIYLTVKGYDFNTKKYSSNYNFSFTISS